MTNQDNQNRIKANTTAISEDKETRLAFVGCENCKSICCDGERFSRGEVLLNELYDTAQLFPVVFRIKEKKITMRFIFSIKKGVPCPYLDFDSKKCTVYEKVRPRVCRSYPFGLSIKTIQDSDTIYEITPQMNCPGIRESAVGLQVINDEGKISDEIIDNFIGRKDLVNYKKNRHATNQFLDLIEEFDLLVKAKIILGKKPLPEGGSKEEVLPILMISEQKLTALGTNSVKRLQTTGYIDAINLHRKSLFHFSKFIQAMIPFEKPE